MYGGRRTTCDVDGVDVRGTYDVRRAKVRRTYNGLTTYDDVRTCERTT